MNTTFRHWLCALLLSLPLLAVAAPTPERVLDAAPMDAAPVSLTRHFALLEDPEKSLSRADVETPDHAKRFTTSSGPLDALSFGYTTSAYWLRLRLANASSRPIERLLEIQYPLLSSIELHQSLADGTHRLIATGLATPFATRPHANRNFVFTLNLPAHSEQLIHLRVESGNSLLVPARLWTPEAFHAYERNDYLIQAWYFGIASAMILFNLMLFVAIRDKIYLIYVGFVICLALSLAVQNGLASEFLWPDSPHWAELALTVGYSLALAALLLFMRRMLNLAHFMPRTDRWLAVPIAFFLLAPLGLAIDQSAVIQPIYVVATLVLFLMLGIGSYRAGKGQRSARFFVVAFVLFLIGAMTNALLLLGLVPSNLMTTHILQLGSTLEMLLLSFALADRIHEIRQEKAYAQRIALHAQQSLVESLQHSERELEQLVAERTRELVEKNRQLEQISITDPLTGLYNRLKLDQVLDEALQRSRRYGSDFALLLLDIDHFKSINDRFGHLIGDQVLVGIADLLRRVTREVDIVGRWGGEEFLLVCPDTDLAGAVLMAEKLRQQIAGCAFVTGLPHTSSIGVTAVRADDNMLAIVGRADAALYRAKQNGRNRVEQG